MRVDLRRHLGTCLTGTLAVALAAGWSAREAQFAQAQGKRIPNTTVNAAGVKMMPAQDQGKVAGKAGVYLDGATAATSNMQVGRYILNPGASPHPPHQHPDEELLIVTKGTGEILVEGKKYPVKPGAVMFADPNVEHGITNTGEKPIEFFWVKYLPARQ